MPDAAKHVPVAPSEPEAQRLWRELGRLASSVLPKGWTLIGGLMVQLHAFEAGEDDIRATTDIDLLGNARQQGALRRIAQALRDDEYELDPPSLLDNSSHRWRRNELVVDLLAPDGLRTDPRVSGQTTTTQIPGGTQALNRTETVEAEIDGERVLVCRPTLLGAILIKARAIREHHDPDAQRADLLLLLSLVEDPRAMAGELKGGEQRWLLECEGLLGLSDGVVTALFPRQRVERANSTYRLLTGT